MLICRYQDKGGPQWGLVEEGIIYALTGDPFSSVALESRTLHPALKRGAPIGNVEEVTLLAPFVGTKVLAIGRNYAAHAAEHGSSVPEEPLVFLKPTSSVVGPGAPIEILPEMQLVEHEAELAVVIGRRGRFISEEEALHYVIGYTCANDVSERIYQRKDGQWTRAKGFDTFCPLGPWIQTDLDPTDIRVQCRVNGSLRQDARTRDMVYKVPRLIAHISRIMTLEAGDVILTGTPEGVGPLHPNDTVEVEIEGIGVLTNPVVLREA